jgi:hypothetical protein
MYARVTTYQADPGHLDELTAKLPAIKEKLLDLDGLVDWYTVWREDGQGVVFTVFDTKSSADASLDEVRKIWSGLGGLLKGSQKPKCSTTSRRWANKWPG